MGKEGSLVVDFLLLISLRYAAKMKQNCDRKAHMKSNMNILLKWSGDLQPTTDDAPAQRVYSGNGYKILYPCDLRHRYR